MKTYTELRSINVNEHTEKKGNLTYLSWTWAVDKLLENDPMAVWTFHEPIAFGETLMVQCTVTAFGKSMTMHLPVMDNKNQAVKNPDSRKVSDAMMRCLAKTIACFGIGLYVYAGEDLPTESTEDKEAKWAEAEKWLAVINSASDLDALKKVWQSAVEAFSDDLDIKKHITDTVKARKLALEQAQ